MASFHGRWYGWGASPVPTTTNREHRSHTLTHLVIPLPSSRLRPWLLLPGLEHPTINTRHNISRSGIPASTPLFRCRCARRHLGTIPCWASPRQVRYVCVSFLEPRLKQRAPLPRLRALRQGVSCRGPSGRPSSLTAKASALSLAVRLNRRLW
ncbi:hypothetical protein EDB92DRAFT_1270051 [Lactarius akahatsu]|uniref:Uncharacterized protein n=1 Tax=Lactarius akahatsu TaxID=416441 RepID=A0AAD4LCL1_9AGAM|nr:hypothetical protein EDB92DRAFT_1270051 [Lactarius akahatsu]